MLGRVGVFAFAMGLWDIFYYVFLWQFAGWPSSPLAPDVLFLIPLPWWGPVLAPVLAAAVMVGAGAAVLARDLGDGVPPITRELIARLLVGIVLCMCAFMADALQGLVRGGIEAAYYARGGSFAWPIFLLGVALSLWSLCSWLLRSPDARQPGYAVRSVQDTA
jgi:hypothetical protein